MSNLYNYGIVGLGPAGIGAALSICEYSDLGKVVCFERGQIDDSILCRALTDTECCYSERCDIISGIGGASTLSNGKLSDYPAGSGLINFFQSEQELKEYFNEALTLFSTKIGIKKVDVKDIVIQNTKEFYQKQGVEYKYYDVYDFNGNMYRQFLQDTVEQLMRKGLHVLDNSEVYDIQYDSKRNSYHIKTKCKENEEDFFVHKLILATGGLDLQNRLFSRFIQTANNDYEIGVRVEVPCSNFGEMLSSHGDLKLKLGAGRTYCVTVNGRIVSYQTGGFRFLEGCSDQFSSSGYTNLAILIKRHDINLSSFLEKYQKLSLGVPIKQRFTDYETFTKSKNIPNLTIEGCAVADINLLFPTAVNDEIKSFINRILVDIMAIPADSIIVVAPELKILRKLNLKNNFEIAENLCVIGAATGMFRGILQSFISGLKCGKLITRG